MIPAVRPLAFSVAAGLALAALAFAWVVPFYSSYDDPAMAMIASGTGFATAPDEHLIFSNVVLGRLLSSLHARYAGVPWYGLHLLLLHVLSAIALLYAALRVAPGGATALLFLAWFSVAGLDFFTRVQFTSTAYVAAQAGLLLALSLRASPPPRAASLAIAAAAVLLMVAAALVRFEALALAGLLIVPVALVLRRGMDRKMAAAAGSAVVVAALAALALRAYDRAYYERDPRWRDFRAFNDALRPFLDYGRANEYSPRTASAFRAVGWSRTDHRLLLQWFHPDDGVFTTAKLRAVLAADPVSAREQPQRRLRRDLSRIARDRSAWCLILVLPLVAILRAGDPRARRALLAAGLMAAAVLVWLMLFRKAPPQVYLPVLSFPAAVGVCLAGARVRTRGALWLAGSLALGAGFLSVGFARSISGRAAAYRSVSLQSLGALRSPPRLIVAWATDFPFDAIAPLDAPSRLGGLRLFSTGWPQRTPVAQGRLAAAGARDVLEALAWRPDVVLIAPRWVLPQLTRYARRHRGWELEFVAEPTTSGLALFRVAHASRLPAGAAGDGGL